MIVTESFGENLVRTYSDSGYFITNAAGEIYGEAVDPVNSGRTYTETDMQIIDEDLSEEATEQDYIDALKEAGII